MAAKDGLGRYGEAVAARHLSDTGMAILDRNWRCEQGELDLVAREGRTAVFVEVKTRRTERFGSPAEAVTPAKADRLRRLALRWLDEHQVRGVEIRFDVVSVLQPPAGRPLVDHLRGVLS
jgi:putative endonuclease